MGSGVTVSFLLVLFIGNNLGVSSRALSCLGIPCIFTLDLPPLGLETHTHQNGNLGGCRALDPVPRLVIHCGGLPSRSQVW